MKGQEYLSYVHIPPSGDYSWRTRDGSLLKTCAQAQVTPIRVFAILDPRLNHKFAVNTSNCLISQIAVLPLLPHENATNRQN